MRVYLSVRKTREPFTITLFRSLSQLLEKKKIDTSGCDESLPPNLSFYLNKKKNTQDCTQRIFYNNTNYLI